MKYYFFSYYGSYLGYMDKEGNFFDERGSKWGRLVGGNKVLDMSGAYRGYVDAQGSYFDAHGPCRGYLRDWTKEPPQVETRA